MEMTTARNEKKNIKTCHFIPKKSWVTVAISMNKQQVSPKCDVEKFALLQDSVDLIDLQAPPNHLSANTAIH